MAASHGARLGGRRCEARACPVRARQRRAWRCCWAVSAVGSVDGRIFDEIGLQRLLDKRYKLLIVEHDRAALPGPCAADDATAALNALALALRAAGRCGPWRDEQLAVCGADGRRLATVERGATRVLGLATQAVHLVGCAPMAAPCGCSSARTARPATPACGTR